MSFESSPYLPERISRSSKTGVSIVTAPWRLKTVVMALKMRSRITMSLPSPGHLFSGGSGFERRKICTVFRSLGGLELVRDFVFSHVYGLWNESLGTKGSFVEER